MRLADDRRGRVPFALLGVLLLLGSTAYAAGLATTGPARENHAVGAAMDRSAASARTALRSAVADAARSAAAHPVTTPANTTAGRVLNDSTPFRDALRLRIYVAARERLRTTRHRQAGVTAAVSLPATPNATALRRAKRRVTVRGVDNGTKLRATIRGLAVEVHRGGRRIARKPLSLTVTVASPVLALHERTRLFERRLNRSALAGPGLGRRLTARLYPLVWARAYAQYGGAPVENVLANRHVALAANGGVLALQRRVYGRSDPDGRRAMHRAGLRVGTMDLLAASSAGDPSWARYVLPDPNGPRASRSNSSRQSTSSGRAIPRAASPEASPAGGNFTVGVNETADVALVDLTHGVGADASLPRLRREGYRATIRLRTAVRKLGGERKPTPEAPGPGWRLVDESVSSSASASPGDGPSVSVGDGEWPLRRATRRVAVRRTVRRTWRRGNRSETTTARWTERYAVGVALIGVPRPSGRAPSRPVSTLFERGGPLDGPNLADLRPRAGDLFEARGGAGGVARKAALGTFDGASVTAVGRRPDGLRGWVYRDLADLRDSVRNVTVSVPRESVASGRANAPARLAAAVRARRAALIDAPATYDGAADRVRVAARTAYVDRVLRRLDERANRTRRANGAFASVLRKAGAGGRDRVSRLLDARRGVTDPKRRGRVGRPVPGGNDTFVPDASPTYLTVAPVSGDRLAAVPDGARYHALAARNTNLFTVPYGDAADGVVGAAFGNADRGSVSLHTAARALVSANRTLAHAADPTLRRRRARLVEAVDGSMAVVRRRARTALGRTTSLSARERRAAVRAALARWHGSGRRALAASNGSLAGAIAGQARRRVAPDAASPARIETEVRVALAEAVRSDAALVPQEPTNRTATRTRRIGRRVLKETLKEAGKRGVKRVQARWLNDTLGAVPAGLPVAPVPGYWYATVNVWTVRVRGEFASFTVRTRRGGPDHAAPLRYVRDGSAVRLDVDGDGQPERLGRSDRISFETGTTVVVAVPPGGKGVGDVGGNADERSPGWSDPGCDRRTASRCRVQP
ncbi:MAG: hypothetical protein ABEJ28_02695 [Salinigranum sp.]